MYSCTLGKVLNLVICLRYMYFFKKYLKLLRLYFRYRYVSLPDCFGAMSARVIYDKTIVNRVPVYEYQ
jgi:hypothetical protein